MEEIKDQIHRDSILEENTDLKAQINLYQETIEKLKNEIRQKDNQIIALNLKIENLRMSNISLKQEVDHNKEDADRKFEELKSLFQSLQK